MVTFWKDDKQLTESVEQLFQTPYYLIHQKELDQNVDNLKEALNRYWDNYIIAYSFKTNYLPWLITYFQKKGLYAEVVSDDEYDLAQLTDYNEKIVYNGVAKSKETFLQAIKQGSIVNIETERELEWLKDLECSKNDYEVGLRVNLDLETYCPNETVTGSEGGRFGFCYENGDLKQAIDFIQSLKNVQLKGLHFHNSTKTRSLNIFRILAKKACEIKEKYNLTLSYIDIGGGFYGGVKGKPVFSHYLKVISDQLRHSFQKDEVTLIVEPGISLVGSPIDYVTTVIDVKWTNRNRFVTTDGSVSHVNALRNKELQFYEINLTNKNREISPYQIIGGFTCMENDRLLKLENYPMLQVGDQIIYKKAGAYTLALSPMFIKYFPAVYVKNDDQIEMVSEKWTANQYLFNAKRKELLHEYFNR